MIVVDTPESGVTRASELLHTHLGMRSDPTMLGRLRRCIRDESALARMGPAQYVEALAIDGAARQRLFDAVTVQETSFFRHAGQFEALANHVLPSIKGPVNIWSAACANGQEAYSLAMVLEEQGRDGSVIATDVSNPALRRTDAGRYRTSELGGLSAERRRRHLNGGPDDWTIADNPRRRVSTRHHNLVTDPLPEYLARCQIVFCRNVLIYFSPPQATAFLTRLAEGLAPGACLFVGYAETIWQATDLFEPVRIGDAFEFHRLRPAGAAAPVPDPARPAPATTSLRSAARPARAATPAPGPARPRPTGGATPAPGRPKATVATSHRPSHRSSAAESPVVESVAVHADAFAAAGQTAAARGDHQAAVTSFRKCVYLAPDDPIAHLHLGLALEASGDRPAAGRAYLAAQAALDRGGPDTLAAALGGYRIEELHSLLASKREDPCP